jgi:hypothetical protein
MDLGEGEKTIPLRPEDLRLAREAAAARHRVRNLPPELHGDDLVPVLTGASEWANRAGQWLVVVTPWGVHRFGDLDPLVVQEVLRAYSASLGGRR